MNVASLAAQRFRRGDRVHRLQHAVLGFARSLMLELRKEGIRVITICPGSVDTGMLRDQPMLKSDPERILRPQDVAESILHTLRPLRALVSEVDLRPTTLRRQWPGSPSPLPLSRRAVRRAAAAAAPRWDLEALVRETGCARAVRAMPAVHPAHAGDRRDHARLLWDEPRG